MKPTAHSSLAIEALRGLAAYSVCFSHFGPTFEKTNPLWHMGRCGVIVFFVISGYVIPLSLARARYRLRDIGRFALKRAVRLYPAFLAVVATIVLLVAIKESIGKPTVAYPGWPQLASNLVFSPFFFGQAYLVPVFWTLTVEWQYYLFIALAYPLLASGNAFFRWAVLGAMLLGAHLPLPQVALLVWLPCFAVGIALWLWQAALLSPGGTAGVIVLNLCSYAMRDGWAPALLPLLFLLVLAVPFRAESARKVAIFLGAISYPLYLFHVPVGLEISVRAWHWLGHSRASEWTQIILILIFTTTAAWLVYRWIDQQAIKWASFIRLNQSRPALQPADPVPPPPGKSPD